MLTRRLSHFALAQDAIGLGAWLGEGFRRGGSLARRPKGCHAATGSRRSLKLWDLIGASNHGIGLSRGLRPKP